MVKTLQTDAGYPIHANKAARFIAPKPDVGQPCEYHTAVEEVWG